MDLFPGSDKVVPCPLCGKNAKQTIIGDHFKCEIEGHLFNQDGSALPEKIECYCEKCNLRSQQEKEEKNLKEPKKLKTKSKRKVKKVKKISL